MSRSVGAIPGLSGAGRTPRLMRLPPTPCSGGSGGVIGSGYPSASLRSHKLEGQFVTLCSGHSNKYARHVAGQKHLVFDMEDEKLAKNSRQCYFEIFDITPVRDASTGRKLLRFSLRTATGDMVLGLEGQHVVAHRSDTFHSPISFLSHLPVPVCGQGGAWRARNTGLAVAEAGEPYSFFFVSDDGSLQLDQYSGSGVWAQEAWETAHLFQWETVPLIKAIAQRPPAPLLSSSSSLPVSDRPEEKSTLAATSTSESSSSMGWIGGISAGVEISSSSPSFPPTSPPLPHPPVAVPRPRHIGGPYETAVCQPMTLDTCSPNGCDSRNTPRPDWTTWAKPLHYDPRVSPMSASSSSASALGAHLCTHYPSTPTRPECSPGTRESIASRVSGSYEEGYRAGFGACTTSAHGIFKRGTGSLEGTEMGSSKGAMPTEGQDRKYPLLSRKVRFLDETGAAASEEKVTSTRIEKTSQDTDGSGEKKPFMTLRKTSKHVVFHQDPTTTATTTTPSPDEWERFLCKPIVIFVGFIILYMLLRRNSK